MPEEFNEEAWSVFDAALRGIERPEPRTSLRERCLPGRSVLVVDDEPNIRRLICLHLERAGYDVAEAADGPAALARVAERRPDLVLLDVMMPGPSGFEILQILKSSPETAAIQVIMLTAQSRDENIRHGWQTGADNYLTKPFNPEELRVVVDRTMAVLDTPDNPPPLRRWLK